MIRKIAKLSLRSILSHKMRSFLTMLGIIIGVMAVVILVSITQSATTGITDSISSMGSQQITATVTGEDVSLSRESVESLAGTGAIEDVAPVLSENQTARHKEESGSFTVAGVLEEQGSSLAGSDDSKILIPTPPPSGPPGKRT